MADLTLAYRKTAAGTEELAAKRLGLARDERNLLIVVDGRHQVSVFATAIDVTVERLNALLDELLRLGLVEPAPAFHPHHAPHPEAAPAAIAHHARGNDVESLRQRLGALAGQVFGAQAQPVIDKIAKAGASHDALVAAVEGATRLAKLTIDEKRATAFQAEAAKILAL